MHGSSLKKKKKKICKEKKRVKRGSTWSSLQSNGRTKEAGGVALTPCKWPNLTFQNSAMQYLVTTNIKSSRMHGMTALASPQPFVLD